MSKSCEVNEKEVSRAQKSEWSSDRAHPVPQLPSQLDRFSSPEIRLGVQLLDDEGGDILQLSQRMLLLLSLSPHLHRRLEHPAERLSELLCRPRRKKVGVRETRRSTPAAVARDRER